MAHLSSTKRTFTSLIAAFFMIAASWIVAPNADASAVTVASTPVVYFTPHQDDETITMGASIYNHVKAGYPVYVVQITDGSSSGARALINKRLVAAGLPELTKAQFSAARNNEQRAALIKLGVKPANIFYESVYNESDYDADGLYLRDSRADYGKFLKVVDKYIKKFPNASYKAVSWLDTAPDHYKIGYALNDRCTQTGVKRDCRFFQSPLYVVGSTLKQAKTPAGVLVPRIATPTGGTETAPPSVIKAAVDEYKLWKPSAGRYAVGSYSVSSQLNYVVAHPTSKYHRDANNWPSTAVKNAAATWVSTYQKPNLTIEK